MGQTDIMCIPTVNYFLYIVHVPITMATTTDQLLACKLLVAKIMTLQVPIPN